MRNTIDSWRRVIASAGAVRRGTAIVLALQTLALPVMYAAHLALARHMGVGEYGRFRYLWSLFSISALLACLGFPYAFQRFIPQYRSEGKSELARGLARGSGLLVLATGVLAWWMMVGLARAGWLGSSDQGLGSGAFIARTGWVIPILAMLTLQTQLARALGAMGVAFVPFHGGRAVAFVAAAALWWRFEGQPAQVALSVIGVVLGWTVLSQRIWLTSARADVVRGGPSTYEWGRWLGVGLPLLAVGVPVVSPGQLGILVAGWNLGGSGAAGMIAAAVQTALFISFALQAVNMATAPALSKLFWKGRRGDVARLMRRGVLASLLPGGVVAGLLILGARPVMSMFGSGFSSNEGVLVLRLVAAGGFVNAMTGPVGQLLNVAGQHRWSAAIQLTSAVAMLASAGYVSDRFGAVGIAAMVAAAQVLTNILLIMVVRLRLGLDAPLWRIV